MDIEKQILIAKGTVKHLPGFRKFLQRYKHTGTNESRYCYTVWLRHLKNWSKYNIKLPEVVTELGPGVSLGTGFAALLSGSRKFFALDVVKFWDTERNLRIFDELVTLFRKKASLPDHSEYPRTRPVPENFDFPSDIITDEVLGTALGEERIDSIRREISDIDNKYNTFIRYKIPWHEPSVLEAKSVDLVYSQAALECIDDLEGTFAAMCNWLKPCAFMSHTIDFKSHGLTHEWNGHWKFSDREWSLVRGGRPFLVNRQPLSKYLELHNRLGFKILVKQTVKSENRLKRTQLADSFRDLTAEDLTTSGAYILSGKGENCLSD